MRYLILDATIPKNHERNWAKPISIDPSSVRTSLQTAKNPNHAPKRTMIGSRNTTTYKKKLQFFLSIYTNNFVK